jgi:hypothetical protein
MRQKKPVQLPVSGAVSGIAVDPSSPTTVVDIAIAGRGVWKIFNAGSASILAVSDLRLIRGRCRRARSSASLH